MYELYNTATEEVLGVEVLTPVEAHFRNEVLRSENSDCRWITSTSAEILGTLSYDPFQYAQPCWKGGR